MQVVKLTDRDGYTRRGMSGETKWVPGVWHEAQGVINGPLCSDSWIHCYAHPLLAVLHNPIHANLPDPIMWDCEVGGAVEHEGLMKSGVRRLRVVRQIPVPKVTTTQRVAYGIYCAAQVCTSPKWVKWAEGWLSGKDRSASAATYAAAAAYATTAYAAADAAAAARYAAYATTADAAADAAAAAADAAAADDLLLAALMAMEIK